MTARNQLVKQLKQAKDRERAAAVAAVRRPTWPDWALNVAAQQDGEVVEGFATAAAEVREAQAAAIEGRDGPDVRDAVHHLRDRTGDVVKVANAALKGQGRGVETPELLARLAEVAANPAAVEQLRTGTLGAEDAGVADLFAGLEPGPARPAPARTKAAPATKAPAEPTATERRQQQRQRDVADKALQKARRALREADSEVSSATDAAAAAERTLRLAQGRLDEATTKRDRAASDVEQAEAAREALD